MTWHQELKRSVGDPDSVMRIDDAPLLRAVAGVKEMVAEVIVPLLCELRVMAGPVRAWHV